MAESINPLQVEFLSVEYPVEKFTPTLPDMWSWNYIGLYAQYAAVGLLYGSTIYTTNTFCPYVFKGDPNVCSNASNIAFFAWNFKIVYAIGTDVYRPFGMRRKPYMIVGWFFVLLLLFVLAVDAHNMSSSSWLTVLMLIQCFLMLSDVPADGYSGQSLGSFVYSTNQLSYKSLQWNSGRSSPWKKEEIFSLQDNKSDLLSV
jgi:BT1 family